MIIYKSKTGRTVTVQGYAVTVDPGLQVEYEIDALEELIPESIEKEVFGAEVVVEATEIKSPVADPMADTDKTEIVKSK